MSPANLSLPPRDVWCETVRLALVEDLGLQGDITSQALLASDQSLVADVMLRDEGVLAGLEVALEVFSRIDSECECERLVSDGQRCAAGAVVATVCGSALAVLAAERTALNFLGHLSGIATRTRRLVDLVETVDPVDATAAKVVCTRKTTPGLRALEKYAVRAGGGANHRYGLFDAVLIKDNHVAAIGDVAEAVRRARAAVGHLVKVEVEVDTLDQLASVLAERPGVVLPDVALLDNMTPAQLTRAVDLCRPHAVLTEASGGISEETIAAVAATGVDFISVGALTHSAPNLDVALDVRGSGIAGAATPSRQGRK